MQWKVIILDPWNRPHGKPTGRRKIHFPMPITDTDALERAKKQPVKRVRGVVQYEDDRDAIKCISEGRFLIVEEDF